MRLRAIFLILGAAAAGSLSAALLRQSPQRTSQTTTVASDEGTISVRIVFGDTQTATRVYDGGLSLSQGSVVRLLPFRLFRDDAIAPDNSWKITLNRIQLDNRNGRPNSVAGGAAAQNIVPAGFTAVLAAPESARVVARTAQGNFDFALAEIPYGRVRTFLDGDVSVERVPTVSRMNDRETGEQHDYPALLETRSGGVWMAWQAYKDRGDHIYVRRRASDGWSAADRLTAEKG